MTAADEGVVAVAPVDGPLVHGLVDSPMGPLAVVVRDRAIVALRLPGPRQLDPARVGDEVPTATSVPLGAASEQLDAYFRGAREPFRLPLAAPGSAFQRRVWAALVEIPFGTTESYGAVAARLGLDPRTASRAVGAANGSNPVAIVVPCHRVIGADGSLTGYAGGLDAKRFLLDHESAHARAGERLF